MFDSPFRITFEDRNICQLGSAYFEVSCDPRFLKRNKVVDSNSAPATKQQARSY